MEDNNTFQKKTKKSRNDTAVQGTNDNSIVSKLSAVTQQYTEDDWLKYVVRKPSRRAPLINRGYYIRTKAMDHVFQSFLKYYRNHSQIVNLGAGFDMTYFKLHHQGLLQNCTYFEVDFPEVMNRKSDLIQIQPHLLSLLKDMKLNSAKNIVLVSSKYKLLGVDLTDLDILSTTLAAVGFKVSIPTLFVSEVVLCYLAPESSSNVIEWASSTVEHGVFLTYEQIYPDDAFGRVMMRHFDTIGSPLRTIRDFPTMWHQIQRYKNKGWPYTKAMDVNYFFHHYVSEAERSRVYHLEPFDEFEEWHLKCTHYMLLTAFCGDCITFADHLWPDSLISEPGNTVDMEALDHREEQLDDAISIVTGCCGQVVDSRQAVKQQQSNISEEDIFSWHISSSSELESQASYNKRFGHTCNVVVFMTKQPVMRDCADSNGMVTEQAPSYNTVSHDPVTPQQNASSDSRNAEALSRGNLHDSEKSLIVSKSPCCSTNANAYILCIGGFGEENNHHGRLSTLQAVLPGSGKASKVLGAGDVFAFDRMYHTATNISQHRLVLFGGRSSPTKPCDTTSVCVITCVRTENGQLHCQCEHVQTTGRTPCPRWRHSAVSVTLQGAESILVYGGRTEDYSILSDLYLLNTVTWSWRKVEPQGMAPEGSHSHTAGLWKSNMLLAGGLTDDEVAVNTIYKLKLPQAAEDQWMWTELSLVGNLRPRYSHTSAVVGDQLFLVGGVTMCYPPLGITMIDLLSNSVVEYEQHQLESELIVMLHNHASIQFCHEDGTDIYIVGGGGNCFSFGTHLNESPVILSVKLSENK